jgi:hypothetical protein
MMNISADGRDQAGFSLHAFVIGHLAMRIADPESGRIPQMEMSLRIDLPAVLLDIVTDGR